MPPDQTNLVFDFSFLVPYFRYVVLLLLVFYAIFALIIVRQVDLMGKTLITPISPVVTAAAIIHAGFAIGLLILVFGVL
ncbi:hypothetical protein HYW42_01075 [Candidatus Daviesbacteria bacterium]|nr:hypothetical protein [Candidatus Daviesbacteria bacterium]